MSERILFGAAYYPEDWPESQRSQDIEMMKKAGMNVMRIGEFAWLYLRSLPGWIPSVSPGEIRNH